MYTWKVGEVEVGDKDYTKALRRAISEAFRHATLVESRTDKSTTVFTKDWEYLGWIPIREPQPVRFYKPITDHAWE